ncbi:hypothetical protein QVD17_35783 [Tagetes erecta]|uniref:Uncharacterized protein n=1 Tax=Tagetes erecta TaxID=13708 RepID=A0AAD8JV17_TARER|nr:hypothetical protein QVD17_35783 [Tagetes erecta]
MADVKLGISDPDLKVKTLEEELEKSRKKLSIASGVISSLKGEGSSKLIQENQELKSELKTGQDLLVWARKQLNFHIENSQFLEETLKSEKDKGNQAIIELKEKLKDKSKSVDDLKKEIKTVRSDKKKVNGKNLRCSKRRSVLNRS